MSKWILFSALWWITGNPLLALLVMLLAAWAADRAFVGVLPDPIRPIKAWMHRNELRRVIDNNPHHGPSLLALGRHAIARWRHKEARSYLERALERMPEEPEARYLLGLAEIGCADVDQGLARIRGVLGEQPRYRQGEPWLEVGARLLSLGRHGEAVEALEGFRKMQSSSIRGLYLLAIAQSRAGHPGLARETKRLAWAEFRTLPRFKKKLERRYAWLANPTRPALYGALALIMFLGTGLLVAQERQQPVDRDQPGIEAQTGGDADDTYR